MSHSSVGEICSSRSQIMDVEWKIENYFSFSQKADTFIQSPIFSFANVSWYLKLYPNGTRSNDSVGWMSLYLLLFKPGIIGVNLNYSMGIKSCNEEYVERDFSYCFSLTEDGFGGSTFIERSELLRNRNKITPGGTLTIFCNMDFCQPSLASVASQTKCVIGASGLSRDFLSLLHSERNSDVIIKVKNQTFNAHKLILGTRSPVFAAMFEHGMRENSTGVVNIADCEPSTFQDFLSFIYTGNIETLSSENVSELFMLSDKYDVGDLREMCIDFLKDNLRLDMACEAVAVADKHDIDDLKTSAKELIINNIKTLIPTEQWISFMRDYPFLAAELLITAIPDK